MDEVRTTGIQYINEFLNRIKEIENEPEDEYHVGEVDGLLLAIDIVLDGYLKTTA